MKSFKKIIIIFLTMILLTGCWDKRELRNLLVVSGVALDKSNEGNIIVTILSPLPKISAQAGAIGLSTETFRFSAEGDSLTSAFRNLERKISREIFLSHTECIIIGESVAREGVANVLDFFAREKQTPIRTYLLMSKGLASEIFTTTSPIEKNPLEEVSKLERLNIVYRTRLVHFYYKLTEEGIEPIIPVIEKVPSLESTGDDNISVLSLTESAAFNNDKLVGYFNYKESRGLLWLRNKIMKGTISANVPYERGGGTLAGQIVKSHVKITPILIDDKIKFNIDVTTEATISESSSKLDFSKPKEVNYVENLYSDEITKLIKLTLRKGQKELTTDVFGFGSMVHGKYPKQWESQFKDSWSKEFPDVDITVTSNVKIFETGFDVKSLPLNEKEFVD
ncbi:MAG: Ger(x)C family spore germination protein [Clostridiaceae bacterium]